MTKDGQFLDNCILQLQMAGYEPTQPEESGDIVKHNKRERECGRAYMGVGWGGGWRKGFIDWDVACLPTVDAADYECIIALFKISTNVHHLYYSSNSA